MNRNVFLIVVLTMFTVFLQPAVTEESNGPESADESVDIDGLFEDESDSEQGDTETSEESQKPEEDEKAEEEKPSSVFEKLEESLPIEVGASFKFIGGYSPGWTEPVGEEGDFEEIPVLALSASLNLLFTISPALSVSQKFAFSYPNYGFKITELAMDYSLLDVAFLTLGLKRINWGRSRNFPFTNIIHRQADTPLSSPDSQKTLVGRVTVPIGIGGITLLVQNKAAYHEDPYAPQGDRIGFGAKYNFARERIDIDVGGYYQRGLSGRLFISGATTVTDWLELYAEGVLVDSQTREDETGPYAGVDEPTTASGETIKDGWVEIAPDTVIKDTNPDFGAAVGVIIGLFDNNLDLNGEYYYNGEETENKVVGSRFPLLWGHNLAFNADLTIPNTPLRFRMGYRYNAPLSSSFLVPRITVDLFKHVTFDAIGGMFWGPAEAGYRLENPDEMDRPAFFSFSLTFSGKL